MDAEAIINDYVSAEDLKVNEDGDLFNNIFCKPNKDLLTWISFSKFVMSIFIPSSNDDTFLFLKKYSGTTTNNNDDYYFKTFVILIKTKKKQT